MKNKSRLHLLWLHGMRGYLRVALFFYYKKIEFIYKEPLHPDQPTLFLGNHQSGLIDPLLMAVKQGRFTYFLSRASVFKRPWVNKVLRSFLMLPVYRVRDGWDSISNNKGIFKTCSHLLHDQQAIMLFPEGSHNIKRQVRPLSKGFTRIIAETLKNYPDLDIQIVPVGFNYSHPEDFADHVVLRFGKPLSSKNYEALPTNGAAIQLKKDVFQALTTLTTHIDDNDYEGTIRKLEDLNTDFLDPEAVNACVSSNFEHCKSNPKKKHNPIKALAKVGLCLALFLPYTIWKLILQPKIEEPEFTATFRFMLVISVVPVFMIVMAVILWLYFGLLYGVLYILSVVVLDVIAVKL